LRSDGEPSIDEEGEPSRVSGRVTVAFPQELGYNNTMIAINEFRRNQSRFPREELAKYNGQYVAWSDDGTRILAAHADPAQMDAMLVAAGYDPGQILVTRIAVPEEVAWGGWFVPEDSAQP
jgi:hypothetical protein